MECKSPERTICLGLFKFKRSGKLEGLGIIKRKDSVSINPKDLERVKGSKKAEGSKL